MKPHLARIPADGDARAEAILRQLPGSVTLDFLQSLDVLTVLACGRYGARQVTVALRSRSVDHLRGALMATALSTLRADDDPRDVMVGLALHFYVAQALGVAPAALFDDVADRIPAGAVAALLREFGSRDDVTLAAFGWQEVQTPDGPDFEPT